MLDVGRSLAATVAQMQNEPTTWRWAMSTETVIWSILGAFIVVGGLLGLAALWSLIRRPREH
ncbi:hypothetical protein ASE14_14870 [Agromyces sp. Root81]|uniref:hypothetical protein n=1 Tax=Agromyces sp. Root81 TaxID=1736601 RepID=UPI0006F7A486|nr:hypothetical protein [Agromyces sp. Root81]KRC59072.1 hypothetical protein ASE14_14870 [Agromyces sp. Root81]